MGKKEQISRQKRANLRLLKRLIVVVIAMTAFGFALVPIYRTICSAAGLNNIDKADEIVKDLGVDKDRIVRIEFDANTSKTLPWNFKPLQPYIDVHPGEINKVFYRIENTTAHPVRGQAIPSYGPDYARRYFLKLQCFCFTQQTLQPHEKRVVPIVFVIDPKLPKAAKLVTLSYTFFGVNGL